MSRYLTPPKLGLLALITLYCEGAVGSAGTVPILSFIVSHLVPGLPLPASRDGEKDHRGFAISMDDFELATNSHFSIHPGRTVYDLLLQKLWQIDSLDALHEFFTDLTNLLAGQIESNGLVSILAPSSTPLSRTSPLGVFVRRAQLEFTRLQFYDALKLWNAFLKYKEPKAGQLRKRNRSAADAGFDVNIDSLNLGPADTLYQIAYSQVDEPLQSEDVLSTDDIERVLSFQAEKLQRLGDRLPTDMKERLRDMIGPSTTVPSLSHFVKFLDAWRAGDYASAFDNLHRYFDYTMQTRDRTYYQYALLHMAILHTDFGCISEAISSINEAIATARENQDMSCLNFSLSWLNHLNQAFPQQMQEMGENSIYGSERDAVNYLKSKARETRMFSLLSSSLLNEARLDLAHAERSASRALQHVYMAAHINIRENLIGAFGAQMLIHSAIYGRLGVDHLAGAYCGLLLQCYQTNIQTEETLRAVCRLAVVDAQNGHYDHALQRIESYLPKVSRTVRYSQYLTAYCGLIKLGRAIRRNDAAASSHFLSQVTSSTSLRPDPEISFFISVLTVQYHVSFTSLSRAHEYLASLLSSLPPQTDIYHHLSLLLLKPYLFALAGRPAKGFSIVLRVASIAHKYQIMPLLWEAIGILSDVLISLGEFDAGKRLLESVLPAALEGGNKGLIASLNSHLADGWMGIAGSVSQMSNERVGGTNDESKSPLKSAVSAGSTSIAYTQALAKADMYLERARDIYARLQDVKGECEMWSKRAIVAQLRGDQKLAEDYAERYLAVKERYQGDDAIIDTKVRLSK